MRSGSETDIDKSRLTVLSFQFLSTNPTNLSIPMASSEKEAALAAVPSDAPTMYDADSL